MEGTGSIDGRRSNGRRKLTDDDVAAIRGHRKARVPVANIAALWGVHRSRIYQLLAPSEHETREEHP